MEKLKKLSVQPSDEDEEEEGTVKKIAFGSLGYSKGQEHVKYVNKQSSWVWTVAV